MKIKKLLALLLALVMIVSLVACGDSEGEATQQPPSGTSAPSGGNDDDNAGGGDSMPNAPTYTPEDGEKYTVELTADGWYKIVNDGGVTLGLHPNSGVHLVEDDGYAFKDLNQNGQLDVYEDWRESTEARTADLVSQMKGEEMAAILSHGGWGAVTDQWLKADDSSYTYLIAGGRGGVSRWNYSVSGGTHAKWGNSLQAVAESTYYGIPAMISFDPLNVSGIVESVALASTMDPDYAAEIGQEISKQYRAMGVTAFLGPQVDIASPVMLRAGGTYGEDPKLTLDIATAFINAMQSSYDGTTDLGWGAESVYCFTKHYGGAGNTEGGRDDHSVGGRYTVFPSGNLEAALIPFFDGAFNLPGKTERSGIMTEYAINLDENGDTYGGEWAGAYNPYMYGLLDSIDYNNLKITDWGVFSFAGVWGAEDIEEEAGRIALGWERGVNLLGGYGNQENVAAAYQVLVNHNGQAEADAIVGNAAGNYIGVMMDLGMFDNPYCDSAYADQIIMSASALEYGLESQKKSVVMIKNDGTIKDGGNGVAKPTVYVPYVYNNGFSWFWGTASEGAGSWGPGLELDKLKSYFNIVTDTVGDPTGPADADGNATYTSTDIVRATPEQIAECDYILVGMTNAYVGSYNKNAPNAFGYMGTYKSGEIFSLMDGDEWYPPSLQYAPYTASNAIDPSISGLTKPDGTKQNRSYAGSTSHEAPFYGHLEALQYASENAGDVPVIVAMQMAHGMVWSEVEPLADVILVTYQINGEYSQATKKEEAIAEIILGNFEPSGLLVFQQPRDMAAVEAQVSDVPRDTVCYVDSAGNTYDFAFGMNWSGVINDSRVQTYSAAPISKIQSIDYAAAAAAAAEKAEAINAAYSADNYK